MLSKIHTAKEQTLNSLTQKLKVAASKNDEEEFWKISTQINQISIELLRLENQMNGDER